MFELQEPERGIELAHLAVDARRDHRHFVHEAEVLELMAQGFRNREIAKAFVIAESTVKVHVRHVLDKLGVRTRTQAVGRYRETSFNRSERPDEN